MFIITLFDLLLIIHEFIYLIVLGIWLFLFKYDYLKSPNPLFAYIITLINNIIILFYMILSGTSFIVFIIYLIYIIFKVFSVFSLIFDYNSYVDYFSILITILVIFIISFISTITTINSNN